MADQSRMSGGQKLRQVDIRQGPLISTIRRMSHPRRMCFLTSSQALRHRQRMRQEDIK